MLNTHHVYNAVVCFVYVYIHAAFYRKGEYLYEKYWSVSCVICCLLIGRFLLMVDNI